MLSSVSYTWPPPVESADISSALNIDDSEASMHLLHLRLLLPVLLALPFMFSTDIKPQATATVYLSPSCTKLHSMWNRGLYVEGYSPSIHPIETSNLASHAIFDIHTMATESSHPP